MRAEYGFSHAFTISSCRSGRNGRLTGAGRLCPERNRSSSLLRATPPFSCLHCRSNLAVARSITSNSSSYAGQTGWEGSEISSSSSSAHSCPWANWALPAGSEDVRDNTSSSSSSLSSAADGHEILVPLTASSASSICDPHDLSLLAASAVAGPEPRGADDCPNSLEKRDIRDRSFPREKSSQCAHSIPSRTERECSSPKHITHRSCVSSGVRKRWHGSTHLLKRFSTDMSTHISETRSPEGKKRMMCSTGAPLCSQTLISLRHRRPPANARCIGCF